MKIKPKKFESLYIYIYTVHCTPIAVSSCRCCLSRGKKLPIANLGQVNLFVCPPRLQFVNFFRHSICFSVFDIMLVTKIRWFLENLFSNFYCTFQPVCSFQFLIWDRLFSCLRYVFLSNSYNTISNVAARRQSLLVCGQIIWVRKKLLARQAERVIC